MNSNVVSSSTMYYSASRMRRCFFVAAVLLSCFASEFVLAQDQSPLQADVRLRVSYGNRRLISFQTALEGGMATVRGTVQNLEGGETALISLHFQYITDADIALDELISQIVVSTRDKGGNEFSRVTIDPNTIPLNPNRVPLDYSGTFYKPPRGSGDWYTVRVQVFGNYE